MAPLAAGDGCTASWPVAVIGSHGESLYGTATADLSGGSWSVAGAGITCSGTYDATTPSRTVSVMARCSDGRTGIGRILRDTPNSGSGEIVMSDGTHARIIFGAAAAP